MSTLLSLLPLAVAAAAGLALLDALIRRPLAGAGLVIAVSLVTTLTVEEPGANLGGFKVTVVDVAVVLLLTAVAARLLRGARLGGPGACVAALGGLVALSIVRGAGEFGLAAAVNESRGVLPFVAATLYFATGDASPLHRERTARLWLGFAAVLVCLAVARWGVVLGGLPFTGEWYDPGQYGGLRVLWSDEALLLAQGLLILAPGLLPGGRSRRRLLLAAALGGSVVVLQHRSVWAVTLVGAALTLVGEGAVGRRWALRVVAAAGLGAVLLLTTFSGPLQERVLTSSDAVNADTFRWRLEGWQILVAQQGPQSPGDALLGRPYGSGWARRLSLGYTTDVAPHNFYLETGLRTGLLGVGLLVGAYAALLRRLAAGGPRGADRGLLTDRTLAVLLVAQLVYFLPYSPGPEQALLLGLAMGAWRARRPAERSRTRTPPVSASRAPATAVVARSGPALTRG